MITPESPYFSHLLAHAVGQIKELPDFSDDEKIAVMSDFGGEHGDAHFNTYSFLILAYNKIGPFMHQVEELRRKHGLLEPYSEFAFKDLTFGPRNRALPEFLHLVDNFIHGAVVTIAIDKEIDTVFGVSKKSTYPLIEAQLAAMGLGQWKGAVAEKGHCAARHRARHVAGCTNRRRGRARLSCGTRRCPTSFDRRRSAWQDARVAGR